MHLKKNLQHALNADIDDGGQAAPNPVGRLAEVVTLALLLDVLEDNGALDNLDVAVDLCVKLAIVAGGGSLKEFDIITNSPQTMVHLNIIILFFLNMHQNLQQYYETLCTTC